LHPFPLLSVQLKVILNTEKLLPHQFVSFSFNHGPNFATDEGDVILHLFKVATTMFAVDHISILVPVQSKIIPENCLLLFPQPLNSVANSASFYAV
jgi:hypothetical protein